MEEKMERYNSLMVGLVDQKLNGELTTENAKVKIEEALGILKSITKDDADPRAVEAMLSKVREKLHKEFM